MNPDVFEKIRHMLIVKHIDFKEVHHPPTKTSAESAKTRGEDISTGGKALVLKIGDSFKLFILSAAKKMDSKAIKQYFHIKRIRFATKVELFELTGLVPGAIPPFGKPILDFPLFVDNSILENQRIAFNAGSLTDSVIMSVPDYMKLAKPVVFDFTKKANENDSNP